MTETLMRRLLMTSSLLNYSRNFEIDRFGGLWSGLAFGSRYRESAFTTAKSQLFLTPSVD